MPAYDLLADRFNYDTSTDQGSPEAGAVPRAGEENRGADRIGVTPFPGTWGGSSRAARQREGRRLDLFAADDAPIRKLKEHERPG